MSVRGKASRLVVGLALVFGLLASVGPAGAGEEPGDDNTVAPGMSATPTPDEVASKGPRDTGEATDVAACTFRAGSEASEFASCLRLDAKLDRSPRGGETVTLTVTIDSQINLDEATVVVDVPDGFTVVEGPGKSSAREQAPRGTGSITRRVSRSQMSKGDTTTLTYRLRADEAGAAPIEVRVQGQVDEGYTEGAMDTVYVTIGDETSAGQPTIATEVAGGVDTFDGTPSSSNSQESADFIAVPLPEGAPINDDATEQTDDSAAALLATSCISGAWGYQHPTDGYTGVPNYTVEVWDDDTFSSDDLLVKGVTGSDGSYDLCFSGADGEGSAAQEVYVKFISANTIWRVRTTAADDDNYVNTTGDVSVADGTNYSFGSLQPGNDIDRGIRAFHAVSRLWNWAYDGTLCFDYNDAVCRQMVINWTNTSTDGTYYSHSANDIHLAAADPDSDFVVMHEATHAIMDDVYNDSMPPAPNCNPHTVHVTSSQGCAWVEGFAEYVPAAVLNESRYVWPNGSILNLENRDWNSVGWDDGDNVEGRVAGAMIDIDDWAVATLDYWDYWSEVDTLQYVTFQSYASLGNGVRPATYGQFWTDRSQDGLDVADAGAEGANYNNTIDFSFRDTLDSDVPWTRPTMPEDDHRYRQKNNLTGAWAVTAIRPDAGSDYDLRYYENYSQTSLLASSTWGGSAMDFVAVDHNHRTPSWDYPRTDYWSSPGDYDIEWATSSSSLANGTSSFYMSSTDLALVRDSRQTSLDKTYYRIVPGPGQDADMALMDSNPGDSGTWVLPRSAAVRIASTGGAGADEAFSFTSGSTDQLGFILLNASGSGTITVYRDTTRPTGSVTINSGEPDTSSTAVDLAITAADWNTGIQDMRISVDGVFDTEPWVPFASVTTAILPAGDGVKNVKVRVRNNADMVKTLTDTIELYTGVRCAGLIPTHIGTAGADTIVGTSKADVIVGLGGADTLDGRGGNDVICGNAGNDVLLGRFGNDKLVGGGGSDTLLGGNGADILLGKAGADELRGGRGADILRGHAGNDDLYGNKGVDRLFGGNGNDLLSGGPGSPDNCEGGAGTDTTPGGCELISSIP